MPDDLAIPVARLIERGVVIDCPTSVTVAPDVDPARVAPGVVIHAGCRIRGATTSVGPGCELGREHPLTIEDCQLGDGVSLAGGYAARATFLDGASLASGAHVRPGTLLEEQASGAHAVGLKQTILFPFVTLGSLVNFCDILMAGGTGRLDHGEVGSSYTHFNFAPQGDKARASLVGDVPRGVMLDQPRVFLGGQGGLVGPARLEFGTVVAAGVVLRGDQMAQGRLVRAALPTAAAEPSPYDPRRYGDIRRLVANCLAFIGNVRALQAWYLFARRTLLGTDVFREACFEGARLRLEEAYDERVRRLADLAARMPDSIAAARGRRAVDERILAGQRALVASWPTIADALDRPEDDRIGEPEREALLEGLERASAGGWVESVAGLDEGSRRSGTAWLQMIVDRTTSLWRDGVAGGRAATGA